MKQVEVDFIRVWDSFVDELIPKLDTTHRSRKYCGVCGEKNKKGQRIVSIPNIGWCHSECSPGRFTRQILIP